MPTEPVTTSTNPTPMHTSHAGSTARQDQGPEPDRILLGVTAVAVAVGTVLRFLPRSGMWLDEALTANIADLPIGEIPEALRRDGHPPLFYVLTHLWASIGGRSDWWLRALPGVCSMLSLPLTYLAGRRLASRAGAEGLGARRTGLAALAIAAVMPFGIRYAAELRMYSLVILLVTGGYLLADDLLSGRLGSTARGLAPRAAGAALVAATLLWTHYWSMWFLAAVGLLALWRVWRAPDAPRRAGAVALLAALAAGGVLFLPWLPDLLYQAQHTGTPWGERFGPASVAVITLVDFAGARFGIAQLLSYLLAALAGLAAVAVLGRDGRTVLGDPVAARVRPEVVVGTATMAIGWLTAYVSGNTFSSRYAAVVFPLFVLCVAAGVAVLRRPLVAAAVLAAIVAACTWGSISVVRFERSQTDVVAEQIAADLAAHGGDAVVVACPDQLGVATHRQLERELEDPPEVVPYPTGGDPRFVDWVDYGERNESSDPAEFVAALEERTSGDTTVYVVAAFTYRTFEGRCEQVFNLLAAGREVTVLVERDDDRHDEVANLWALRPPA